MQVLANDHNANSHVLASCDVQADREEVLEDAAATMDARGHHLLLVGMRPEMMAALEQTGTADAVGREDMFPTMAGWFVAMDHALERALELAGETESCGLGPCPLRGYLQRRQRNG